MLRKIISFTVLCMVLFTLSASAEDLFNREKLGSMLITLNEKLNTSDNTTEIPDEYNNCNKTLKLAASKGLMPLELIKDEKAEVKKQDAVLLIYNILTSADPKLALDKEQAETILNSCYDNGYIKEENKIAYASMIRHGVIDIRGKSNPDEIFTDSEADAFINRIYGIFLKKYPITVGKKTISIGSSVNEVFTKLGDPVRIDKSENDVSWYIYNSRVTDFIAVGIKNDVVCAYFSNAATLDISALPPENDEVTYIYNKSGDLGGVYCNTINSCSKLNGEILSDIINAHRAKDGLMTFVSNSALTSPTIPHDLVFRMVETVGGECFVDAYKELIANDTGDGILSYPFGIASEMHSVIKEDGTWEITAIDAKSTIVTMRNTQTTPQPQTEEKLNKISSPKIVSPTEGETTKGGALTLKLKKRSADKYLVRLYNCETESYDVYAYILTDKDSITVPAYMLTDGNVYWASVSAVSDKDIAAGNAVVFTHGTPKTRIQIMSPADNLSTYDDELEISLYSSAYKDYRVDIYDKNNNLVLTQELKNTNNCILDSLPAGKYNVCATAVSHADATDKGNAFVTVTIKDFKPVIKEIILEPGETYKYYYGDGNKWIYMYDTETIAVTETIEKIVTVPDTGNESGSNSDTEQTKEEKRTEEITVYKTKITQRKLPATKRFKALAGIMPQYRATNGASSNETGYAIAAMALSYRGIPYVWGGTTPSGFDCSGLVKYICNSLGIKNVARTSREQFAYSGVSVEKNELAVGDLLFFEKNGVIHHVGIYIGNDRMVHAPHTGDVVKISNLNDDYYQKQYAGAKRVH